MGLLSIVPLPYRLLAYALAALALFAFGWVKGNDHGTQKLTEYVGKQAVEAVRIITKRGAVTTQVITKYIEVAGKTKVVTETVEKEVVKYADANPGSCLDYGWGRLHDVAALNRVPGPGSPAPGPVRTPPAAPAAERPRVAEGGGGAVHGHLQLRQASSLRGSPG